MGRLAKAPMMKQAMQEEAAVAVMRDFLVVACRQQGGPHQLGHYSPGVSAEEDSGWTGCQQVSSCAHCVQGSHTAVGGRSPRHSNAVAPPAVGVAWLLSRTSAQQLQPCAELAHGA